MMRPAQLCLNHRLKHGLARKTRRLQAPGFQQFPDDRSAYLVVFTDDPTVDLTGGPPGSCAIDFVRDDREPFLSLVWVIDLLHSPPSFAIALAWPFEAFGLTLDFADALPPAALPPTPIEEDAPALPVDVPAVPSVEADVPPEAAPPPLPTVPDELVGDVDAPPVATPLAPCATAYVDRVQNAMASRA